MCALIRRLGEEDDIITGLLLPAVVAICMIKFITLKLPMNT